MQNWVPVGELPDVSVASQQALLVQMTVAELTGVRFTALCGENRGSVAAAFARQTAMYLCRLVFAMSLQQIAVAFGRDRTTVKHAILRIEEAREDPQIDRRLAFLESALRRAGAFDG